MTEALAKTALKTDDATGTIPWRNSEDRYGRIAMILHWSVALIFLGLYASVYYRQWFTEPRTDINWTALQIHLSLGMTALVVVALRVVYRLYDKTPKDLPGSNLAHRAAHSAHWALYAVMIVMPITGYLGTGANTEFFFIFDIPKFEATPLHQMIVVDWLGITDFKVWEKPIDFIHKNGGAYVVWVLIAGHVAAAIHHHKVRRDTTMKRMLPVKLD